MKDGGGRPADLYGRAVGAMIEVLVDHDKGMLSYRVNNGPVFEALKGFPIGAALRPFAVCLVTGRVRLVTPYV